MTYSDYGKDVRCARRQFLKNLGLKLVRLLNSKTCNRGFSGVYKSAQLVIGTVVDTSEASNARKPKKKYAKKERC